jgi:hypothetical protein
MSIIDDPTLALIARFVVDDLDNLSITDEAFLKSQVNTICSHIHDAPAEQHQQLALAWINEHAERYRQEWQRKTLSECISDRRCHDCPLIHSNGNEFCSIHSKWVILLNEYVTNKIDSEKYIVETIQILSQYKNDLKVSEFFQ